MPVATDVSAVMAFTIDEMPYIGSHITIALIKCEVPQAIKITEPANIKNHG